MPRAWSNKDERKYEHIREGYEERGVSHEEAQERAARTVNKARKEEGRTREQHESRRSSDEPTKEELYSQARKLDIEGRSKMNKSQLKRAVKREQ